MTTIDNFISEVFVFIETTYNKGLIRKVKSKKNKEVVVRLIASSFKNDYAVDRTGNKIIAMLRLNP